MIVPETYSLEIADTEAIFRRFVDVYGPNEVEICKECSMMDGRGTVRHPL